MNNYDHLPTNAMRSRYVLAADHIKDAASVLEIGGNQMWEFLPWNFHKADSSKSVECIDPCAGESPLVAGITYHNVPVQEFDMKSYLERQHNKYTAAVLIGIEMEIGRYDLFELRDSLLNFNVVVMDHVMSNSTADLQASILENGFKYGGFHKKIELLLAARYDHEYMSTHEEFTPSLFKNRLFQVFEKA